MQKSYRISRKISLISKNESKALEYKNQLYFDK